MACLVLWSLVTPFERGAQKEECELNEECNFWRRRVRTQCHLKWEELRCNFWQRKVQTQGRFQCFYSDVTSVFLSFSFSLSLSLSLSAPHEQFTKCFRPWHNPTLSPLRQDPLEAILVIFGRRALIFFCLKALGRKRKMTPLLCACAVVITLERRKNAEKGHLACSVEFNFLLIAIDRNGFRRVKEEGQIYKTMPHKVKWWFYPVFSTLKDHN